MTEEELIDHGKFAINPKFQDWVLFENGTYIIFDDAATIADLKEIKTEIAQKLYT